MPCVSLAMFAAGFGLSSKHPKTDHHLPWSWRELRATAGKVRAPCTRILGKLLPVKTRCKGHHSSQVSSIRIVLFFSVFPAGGVEAAARRFHHVRRQFWCECPGARQERQQNTPAEDPQGIILLIILPALPTTAETFRETETCRRGFQSSEGGEIFDDSRSQGRLEVCAGGIGVPYSHARLFVADGGRPMAAHV